MTVEELIQKLAKMPADAEVFYDEGFDRPVRFVEQRDDVLTWRGRQEGNFVRLSR